MKYASILAAVVVALASASARAADAPVKFTIDNHGAPTVTTAQASGTPAVTPVGYRYYRPYYAYRPYYYGYRPYYYGPRVYRPYPYYYRPYGAYYRGPGFYFGW